MTRALALKTTLRSEPGDIQSLPTGELLTEPGITPLQYRRRCEVMKTLDMIRPPARRGGRSPRLDTRPATDAPASVGFRTEMPDRTRDAALHRSDAHPVELNAVEFLMARRYRERVEDEIRNRSERGARWW